MALTYLEELTIRTFVEMGIPINVLFRPAMWLYARRSVARLLACNLDPEDSLTLEMPHDVAANVILIAQTLQALRQRYRREGESVHG